MDDGLGGGLSDVEGGDTNDFGPHEALVTGDQMIILPEGSTRADVVRYLSKPIPLNEYQLPDFFYRSDLLPSNIYNMSVSDCDVAVVHLDYYEGYPTFDNGKIFWFQLPYESFQDYTLFQRYLNQPEEIGLRQLQTLAMENNLSTQKVMELAGEYMWAWRSRAYDLFQVAAERKRREVRARNVENKHYNASASLLEQLLLKFENPEWINELSAKEGIAVLETLAKLQRMSVGLAANGNAGNTPINHEAAANGADLMREITRNLAGNAEGLGISNNLQQLLKDPSFALDAQALIIRVRGSEQRYENSATGDGAELIEGEAKHVP